MAEGHARNDSVFRQRRPSQSARTSPYPAAASLTTGSPSRTRGPSPAPDVLQAISGKRRRKAILQGLAALAALALVLAVTRTVLFRRTVSHTAKWRRHQLAAAGTGESFVLPKRWRESKTVDGDELPACRRVLLFTFGSEKGFGHEFQAYIRAHVMAQKLSYTLLADDTQWNYGSLREYFLPRQIHCRPPADWFIKESAVALGSKRWANEDRVWFSTELAASADDWIRSDTLDANAMKELHRRQYGHILPQGQTLPAELEDVFGDFSASVKELWRPNDQLAILIRSLRMDLGLGAGGLRNRKNSPAWGGARRKGADGRRPPVEEVAEDDHDYDEAGGAERSDRGPLIGAHVRSPRGERAAQWSQDMAELGVHGQQFGNLTLFLEGAQDAIRRLSKSSIAEPGYSRTAPILFPETAEPTLLVMTAESNIVPSLESRPDVVDSFSVKRTSVPPPEVLKQWDGVLGSGYDSEGRTTTSEPGSPGSILASFDQKTFNALPRNLRIILTRYFLRDLTTLSLYADSFLVTASSNIGRIACLIAGEDAVIGPRAFATGHGLGGRVRSLDAPWHPMAHPSALFKE